MRENHNLTASQCLRKVVQIKHALTDVALIETFILMQLPPCHRHSPNSLHEQCHTRVLRRSLLPSSSRHNSNPLFCCLRDARALVTPCITMQETVGNTQAS